MSLLTWARTIAGERVVFRSPRDPHARFMNPPIREVRQREPLIALRAASGLLHVLPSELHALETGEATVDDWEPLWRALGRRP